MKVVKEVVLSLRCDYSNKRPESRIYGPSSDYQAYRVVRIKPTFEPEDDTSAFVEPEFVVEQRQCNDSLGGSVWRQVSPEERAFALMQYLCHLEDGGDGCRRGVAWQAKNEADCKAKYGNDVAAET